MQADILLIEDDKKIREIVIDYFEFKSNGEIKITWADNGPMGLNLALNHDYDLVLLDIMLPGKDGYTVCRELRKSKNLPVFFLTAKSMEKDCLEGYSSGGDDYIIKPFSVAELFAKVNAFISRTRNYVKPKSLTLGNISIDLEKAEVRVADKVINLPLKEYEMLQYFINHKNMLITRGMLIVNIWDWDADVTDRVVDNHVMKLRKAIKDANVTLETLHKQGYRMNGK